MAEEFSQAITRQAIARAALALDFKEADEDALQCLAEVMQRYLETIGVAVQSSAEASGRAYPGSQDAIAALENEVCFTTHSLTHWLTGSLTCSFTHLLIHSLAHSLTRSITHSLTHWLNHSLAHSLTGSLNQSLAHSLIY
jgi:histone H3/H4